MTSDDLANPSEPAVRGSGHPPVTVMVCTTCRRAGDDEDDMLDPSALLLVLDAMTDLTLRPADAADHDAIWAILEPVYRAGETYCIPRDISRGDALADWFAAPFSAFVAEQGGDPVLQRVQRRVLAVDVVPDLGLGHRPAHAGSARRRTRRIRGSGR